jgi:hypothetical protein
MFNLIVKDPSGTPPKRYRLDRGPTFIGLSSNLLRSPLRTQKYPSAFWRELFKTIELFAFRQALTFSSFEAAPTQCWRNLPHSRNHVRLALHESIRMLRTAHNLKDRPAQIAGASRAHRSKLLGLAMVCSLRDSQQGFRGYASPDPTNHLPISLSGRPFSHWEHPLLICNFLRVAQASPLCKRLSNQPNASRCNFLRIAILQMYCKCQACGKPLFSEEISLLSDLFKLFIFCSSRESA